MKAEIRTSLVVSRTVAASMEEVFDAWTRPELMQRWMAPEGVPELEVTADVKRGGSYRIHMKRPEVVYTAFGTYLEVTPPKRLVFTWDWVQADHSVGETLVTVEFKQAGASTEVTVTHDRFPNGDAADGHQRGWDSCLDKLVALHA